MPTIRLNHITKVEGHATLTVKIENGRVEKCELGSVEGSRYFEGMLKGRFLNEATEITSRICGICSCAHTVCSVMAMENLLGITPTEQTVKLRELLTIGERIRSHAAHLYFLALPDYLGFESAIAMASKYKKEVETALRLMKLGNRIIFLIGGREIHPTTCQIGGFTNLPKRSDLEEIRNNLKERRSDAIATANLFSKLKIPNFNSPAEYFSLHKEGEYALLYGSLKSPSHEFDQKDYQQFISEYHEPYSTANFVVKKDKPIMVGSLARVNNNHKYLSDDAKKLAKFPSQNPFMNNLAQAVELLHYIDQALQILDSFEFKDEEPVKYEFRSGHGIAIIEVPRGLLLHEYRTDESGRITHANIITPTAYNLLNIQEDVRKYLGEILNLDKDKMVLEIEKLIRAYDPCFSCSTHFLKVKWL